MRDFFLARLKHYLLGALKVVWEFERREQRSLLAGGGLNRECVEQQGFLSCVNTCLLLYTSFCHNLHNVFSTRSPLAAEINLCLGGRWSQHAFEPVLCQGMATWGCVQVVLLLIMHVPESWSVSRVVKALLVCLRWQRTMAATLGLLPLEILSFSFCSPSDRRRGCVASGWCLHFRSESSETGRMRTGCLSLCSWHLGWFWVGYSFS